ncbi:hypothetical protein C8Q73DRAFT_785866 [Cubamyces lactineus]|nr:hypothetical protein C8Q73DRAFT_785866 [Cubamyces lactineus]
MRLLDTETGRFLEIANPTDLPYAILSHTWDPKGEQTYQDVRKVQATYETPSIISKVLFYIGTLLLDLLPSSILCDDTKSSTPISALRARYAIIPFAWARYLLDLLGCYWSRSTMLTDNRLSEKIRGACAYARADGNRYLWIDSCCIDKSSSAELSEAINSMYMWYQTATVCYVFLSDVTGRLKGDMDHEEFFYSRWHTRGWTLQELLAPAAVVFLSRHWLYLGTKFTLALQLEHRLGIPHSVLTRAVPMEDVSVAQRFSWAAQRETTRAEDRAYCLLGIFRVTMPPLYGEGSRAFYRLQQAIWAQRPDHSIFAWDVNTDNLPQRLEEIEELYVDQSALRYVGSTARIPGRKSDRILSFISDTESHFAGFPASFAEGAKIRSISPDEYRRRLGRLPLSQAMRTIPLSPGGPIYLPLIPLEACLPADVVVTPSNSLSDLCLVPLACEWDSPRHDDSSNLVAIISSKQKVLPAYTEPPPDSVEVLQGALVRRWVDGRAGNAFRTVILTRRDLDRCRESMRSRGVLPNRSLTITTDFLPRVTDSADNVSPTTSATVHLAGWTQSSLVAQGYHIDVLDSVLPHNDLPRQEPVYGFKFTRDDAEIGVVLHYLEPSAPNSSLMPAWTFVRVGLVPKDSHTLGPDDFVGLSPRLAVAEGGETAGTVSSVFADGPTYHFTANLRRASRNTFVLGFDLLEIQ